MKYGRYEVVNEVGRGSMGVVYRAYDPQIDRTVALKVLRPDRVTSDAFVKRFLKEAKAIGRLSHPNIVAVFDVGEDQGSIYIAMEFLEGRPLQEVIQADRLELSRAVDLVIQVAESLDYAHQKGVVHRDIKPSNIILTPDGRVKITDFGIAHVDDPTSTMHTMVGEIMGTPAYMSPQQVLGQPTDGRTDLFSLGVILYELCTGRRPFGGEGKSLATVFNEIVKDTPPEPATASAAVPQELSTIIMRCLSKTPENRFQTGLEFADALRKTREVKVEPPPVSAQPVIQVQAVQKSATWVLLVAVLALLAVGGFMVWDRLTSQASKASVVLESAPVGAEIYIDGEPRGKTPSSVMLPLGKYQVRLSLAGFQAHEMRLELSEARQYPVSVRLQPMPPPPLKSGVLKVVSVPPGAEVYVDGERRGVTPGTLELSPGGHQVRLALQGYADFSTQVQLTEAAEYPLNAELLPEPAKVTGVAALNVISEPAGADLFIDGKFKGKTPQQVPDLPVGWHQLRLALDGYSTREEHVQLSEPRVYPLRFELSPQVSKPVLLADSEPGGASIYVNDLYKGKAPLRLRMPSGKYLVRMTLPGYEEWSSQVEIGESGDFPVTGKLKAKSGDRSKPPADKPKPATGKPCINVQSTPSSAKVYVDGSFKGTTPVKIDLTPGKHRVRVSLAGYQSWEHQVEVRQVREHPINIYLKPSQ